MFTTSSKYQKDIKKLPYRDKHSNNLKNDYNIHFNNAIYTIYNFKQ